MLIEQKEELTRVVDEKAERLSYSIRESTDELSTIDNHPADLATELSDRERDMAIEVHNEDIVSQIDAAFDRIENGTYGSCANCHEDIPYDRLMAIPYTAFCIEHTEAKYVPNDRPIEEDHLLPPVDNSFSNREANDELQDNEDSFQIVAQYGSSDTPSDFEGDYDHYNDLYKDKDGDSMFSDLEKLHVSKTEELTGQISQQYADEARKYDYLE